MIARLTVALTLVAAATAPAAGAEADKDKRDYWCEAFQGLDSTAKIHPDDLDKITCEGQVGDGPKKKCPSLRDQRLRLDAKRRDLALAVRELSLRQAQKDAAEDALELFDVPLAQAKAALDKAKADLDKVKAPPDAVDSADKKVQEAQAAYNKQAARVEGQKDRLGELSVSAGVAKAEENELRRDFMLASKFVDRLTLQNQAARYFRHRLLVGWTAAGAGGGSRFHGPYVQWGYRAAPQREVSAIVSRATPGGDDLVGGAPGPGQPTVWSAAMRATHGFPPFGLTYGLGIARQMNAPGAGWTVITPQLGVSFATAWERQGFSGFGLVGEARFLVTPWIPLDRAPTVVFFGLEVGVGLGLARGGEEIAARRIRCGDD